MKILTFLLAGPLQSWGDSARWDSRGTASMPTKSAVIGLLGCCFGYPRGDIRLKSLSEQLHIAVRADRAGYPFWDFQTVQNPGRKILNAMGKPRGETIITPKQYLQDAAFQIFVFGEESLLDRCRIAMLKPQWPICLGRRSCPPAIPIIPHLVEYISIEEALRKYFDPHVSKRAETMACQVEAVPGVESSGQIITKMDEVVRADVNHYGERTIYAYSVQRSE